jgi:hypothetical protein
MGRYYNGDIEGKFWFGLQSSDAADRFGVTGEQPPILNYYFEEDNLDSVCEEIKNIEESLGDKLGVIESLIQNNGGYTSEMLAKANVTEGDLSEYADLLLGRKIRDCIEDQGYCSFEAEY